MIVTLLALLQDDRLARIAEHGIGPWAILFMVVAMGSVASLTAWCYWRILRRPEHLDPDGTGPLDPPVPGEAELPPRR
jgi:hypothetical protein